MIKTTPKILIMQNDSVELELLNPTTFDMKKLTYAFTNGLDKYLDVEQKEYLVPHGFRLVTVNKKLADVPDTFGYLIISNLGDPISKIPVIISSNPEIVVTAQDELTVFGTKTTLQLDISKSSHEFNCSLTWDQQDINTKKQLVIKDNGQLDLDITFKRAETVEKVYTATLSCRSGTTVINNEFSVLINKFSSRPFLVEPKSLYINESRQNAEFTITNLLDQTIDIVITSRNPDPYFELSDNQISLYPGEVQNVTIYNSVPLDANHTSLVVYTVKTFNLEEEVTLVAEIYPIPPKTRPLFLTIIYFVLMLSLFGAVGYYGYTHRQQITEWYNKHFHKATRESELKDEVHKFEKMEQTTAILNMIDIYRLQKISEQDIRKRLNESGFNNQDIDDALHKKASDDAEKLKLAKSENKKS